MAPSTRLGAQTERRIDYRYVTNTGRAASARNPIVLEDMPSPQEPATRPTKTKKAANKSSRDTQGRLIRSESSEESRSDRRKVVKGTATPRKDKKVRPDTVECIICATIKNTKRSFKASRVEDTCEHFESVCNICIRRLIKTKISEHQLTDAHLPCMFPDCKAVLTHTTLKKVISKGLFETWDTAVTKHLLAEDPSYIACLNPECSSYFSVEDCGSKLKTSSRKSKSKTEEKAKIAGEKATCPYCEYELCLSCNRSWHLGSCNSARRREDKQSEKAIKKMGAKPCPKCGINIEKQGGCDHMTCQRCRHNFCWECLGGFRGNADDHTETCSHRHPMIAQDIGNFADENLTVTQVNALIERARQDREAGRVPQPNLQLAPGMQLVNGAAVRPPPAQPPPRQEGPTAPHPVLQPLSASPLDTTGLLQRVSEFFDLVIGRRQAP